MIASGKRARIVAISALFLGIVWLVYYFRSVHSQAQRDAGYRAVLSQYRHDLHAGMTRAFVANYLESRHIRYGETSNKGSGNAWSYQVRIGTDPSGTIACGNWEVYVVFDFDNPTRKIGEYMGDTGDPSDLLKGIRIYKFCW